METKNIYQKMLDVQREVQMMKKEGYNDYNKYNYLMDAQVMEMIKPLLEKNGILFYHSNEVMEKMPVGKQLLVEVKINYAFISVDGPNDRIIGSVYGHGADTVDKGIYKAITGGIKYIFMKTFLIPTGDDPEKTNKRGSDPIADQLQTKLSRVFEEQVDAAKKGELKCLSCSSPIEYYETKAGEARLKCPKNWQHRAFILKKDHKEQVDKIMSNLPIDPPAKSSPF